MEFPDHGTDMQKLWNFVGAHVEDKGRKRPCPLARKAWTLLATRVMAGYLPRRGKKREERLSLPDVMPGRWTSWADPDAGSGVKWTEK